MKTVGIFVAEESELDRQVAEAVRGYANDQELELRPYTTVSAVLEEFAVDTLRPESIRFAFVSHLGSGRYGSRLLADARELRKAAQDVPLLILRADSDCVEVALDCLSLAKSDFVVWPIRPNALAEIVGYLIQCVEDRPPFGRWDAIPNLPARPCAFVAMPFAQRIRQGRRGTDTYVEVFRQVIDPTLRRIGWNARRADSVFSSDHVGAQAQKLIRECDLVLADVSDQNVNVYYELGYAEGVGKPVILIRSCDGTVAADLAGRFCIEYDNKVELSRKLICALGKWGEVRPG
jgi:hypothetical protein